MMGAALNRGGPRSPKKKKKNNFLEKIEVKQINKLNEKKQSLVLILVIWLSPKKIRALFLDCMDISNKCFWPYSRFFGLQPLNF
jgi:hypothetical protein